MTSKKSVFGWVFKSLLIIIGVALLVTGGIFISAAYSANKTVKTMERPLVEIPIDLSKPGQYTETVPEVKNYFHGLVLIAEVVSNNQPEPAELLEGFLGRAIIIKGNGEFVGEIEITGGAAFSPQLFQRSNDTFCFIFLESFPEYESEMSQLSITITKGATKLAGQKQTLILRYNLCGLESTIVFFSSMIGIVCSLVGLGITIPMSAHIVGKIRQRARG